MLQDRFQVLHDALMKHLETDNSIEVIAALERFQNVDGGIGHGFEADIQMPGSNVASTNLAVNLLEDITDSTRKFDFIQSLVHYYETVYCPTTRSFEMVPPTVMESPHAIWWDYDALDSFTFGNPNPEIAGFLYQYRQYIKSMDLNALIDKVVTYILHTPSDQVSMHSLMSFCRFYERVDDIRIRQNIRPRLETLIQMKVEWNSTKWDEYVLEPYKLFSITPSLMMPYRAKVMTNMAKYSWDYTKEIPLPNWQWYQFEEIFETVKYNWSVIMMYDIKRVEKLLGKQ